MVFNGREEVCPVCNISARVTRKWVLNKYGKRYDYFIFHHIGFVHYSNQNNQISKEFRKGELEKILIETINSQDFKMGSFKVKDIKLLLIKTFPNVGFGSIKISLNRLAEIGIIERRKKGRGLYFISTVSKDRLSFIIDSLTIGLEDVNKDNMFDKHIFIYKVKNDHSWPLYFIPFRYVGDVDIAFDDMEMLASDPSSSKELKVILVEDAPTDKRILLKLSTPLLPEELRGIRIEYNWPEPKQLFVFSAATKMNSFEFSVSGKNSTKLMASLTSASTSETRDISGGIKEYSSSKWKSISRISITDVESFCVLQLKWKQT